MNIHFHNNKMGAKDNLHKQPGNKQVQQQPHLSSDQEQSNETSHHLPELSLLANHSQQTQPPECSEHFSFLKNKPIRKRNRQAEGREHLKNVIQKMDQRIEQLENLLSEYQSKENACPHCHFYQQATALPALDRSRMSVQSLTPPSCNRSTSKESLQFEQIDFTTPLLVSAEMEEKSWVFLGTMLIAMGSKVMDMDGTVNVFKIVKESVDHIRRQVEKSEKKLTMDFFLSKQEFMPEGGSKMDELGFDPFYSQNEPVNGLQLDGVRVESVEEYDLYFDQKLSFNVNYDALITAMEYLKENSQLSFK